MSNMVWLLVGLAYVLGFVLESKRLHDSIDAMPEYMKPAQLDMIVLVTGLFFVWWYFFLLRVKNDEY